MLHRTSIEPVRFTRDDPDLRVRAVRGVGFRYVCACGVKGARVGSYHQARIDAASHRQEVLDAER